MESNKRLQVLKNYIGKEFTISPSLFGLWMKPTVVAADLGAITFSYQIREEMTNAIGTLHGGVTAAIADDIIGVAMFSLNDDHFYTTLNLVVDYFAPIQLGDTILASTAIIKKGRQFVNAQCEIWNADKTKLIARATSNLFKTDVLKTSL